MKAPIICATLLVCSLAFGQTNIITFTNNSGEVIRNAVAYKIAPNKLMYKIPTGGGIVNLGTLPVNIQTEFNYDRTNALAADLADKQKRLAELNAKANEQRWLDSLRGTNQIVRVTSVYNDVLGECQISGQIAVGGRVYVRDLPASIPNFYEHRVQLRASIAELRERKITVTATVPVDYSDYGEAAPLIAKDTSNRMVDDALKSAEYDKELKLGAMQQELDGLDENEAKFTTIVAYSTGLSYGAFPIWQYVGAAQ